MLVFENITVETSHFDCLNKKGRGKMYIYIHFDAPLIEYII